VLGRLGVDMWEWLERREEKGILGLNDDCLGRSELT
jgi:hypothetical protein